MSSTRWSLDDRRECPRCLEHLLGTADPPPKRRKRSWCQQAGKVSTGPRARRGKNSQEACRPRRRVLDLATGNGRVMAQLLEKRRDLKLLGIDRAAALPPPPRGSKIRAGTNMEDLPLPDGQFAAVTSQFGFEYGDDAEGRARSGACVATRGTVCRDDPSAGWANRLAQPQTSRATRLGARKRESAQAGAQQSGAAQCGHRRFAARDYRWPRESCELFGEGSAAAGNCRSHSPDTPPWATRQSRKCRSHYWKRSAGRLPTSWGVSPRWNLQRKR